MARMRTLLETMLYLKEQDANSAVTPYALRRLVISGQIPYVKAGNKYLLNLDRVEEYLSCLVQHTPEKDLNVVSGIRPLPERMSK